MAFLRACAAWLLVALWLPASSHLHLEHLGVIHEIHPDHVAEHAHCHAAPSTDPAPGHHEHGAAHHAAADGECVIAHAGACLEAPVGAAPPPLLPPPPELPISLIPAPVTLSETGPPGTAPPFLRSSWHFLLRAALPVRAPSLAS